MDKWTAIVWMSVACIVISVTAMICVTSIQFNETKRTAFENGFERIDYPPTLGSGWYKAGTERTFTIK